MGAPICGLFRILSDRRAAFRADAADVAGEVVAAARAGAHCFALFATSSGKVKCYGSGGSKSIDKHGRVEEKRQRRPFPDSHPQKNEYACRKEQRSARNRDEAPTPSNNKRSSDSNMGY